MHQDNRTAIVTGASSGIGLEIARTLLQSGYQVVANSRRISRSKKLTPSENLVLMDGDVSQPETGARLVETARRQFGSVGLLVNNAGVFIPKPFTEYSEDDFQTLLATNLAGFFHVTQPTVAQMISQKSGHIVNISTTLAVQPLAAVPAALPILTKGGLNAVTRALAIELAAQGIRVNAIGAGIIDTPMHDPANHDFLKTLHPIQRLGEVSEISRAVLYLSEASFVTGEVLHVDGGAHAGRW
ncbi:MAG TPA: SDR family oxidoreductase [Acidobacteriota bacterium]|nr:SDR family oxidoreductase [Acidobacteriota bacterium]